jgi:hypothetical protein
MYEYLIIGRLVGEKADCEIWCAKMTIFPLISKVWDSGHKHPTVCRIGKESTGKISKSRKNESNKKWKSSVYFLNCGRRRTRLNSIIIISRIPQKFCGFVIGEDV